MFKTLYMTIESILIYGEQEWLDIEYDIEGFPFISFNGEKYRIDEYMITKNTSFEKHFDGYASDSFFSGTLIKLSDDNDQAQLFFYMS